MYVFNDICLISLRGFGSDNDNDYFMGDAIQTIPDKM